MKKRILVALLLANAAMYFALTRPAPPQISYKEMSTNIIHASGGFQNLISTCLWLGAFSLIVAAFVNFNSFRKLYKKKEASLYKKTLIKACVCLVLGLVLLTLPFIQTAGCSGGPLQNPYTQLNATPP